MNKIKKGDKVIAIAGKDKGKQGEVLSVSSCGERLVVKGINVAKKHVKANPNANEPGGIIPKEMPIHRSNVMHYDSNTKKRSRVGIRVTEDGRSVRYLKSSDQVVDIKA